MHLILLLYSSCIFSCILMVDLETVFFLILLLRHFIVFVLEFLLELVMEALDLLIGKHVVLLAK